MLTRGELGHYVLGAGMLHRKTVEGELLLELALPRESAHTPYDPRDHTDLTTRCGKAPTCVPGLLSSNGMLQWDVAMAADGLLCGEVLSPEPPRFAIAPMLHREMLTQ